MFYYRVETRMGGQWQDDVVVEAFDQPTAWTEVCLNLRERGPFTEVKVNPCKRNGNIIV